MEETVDQPLVPWVCQRVTLPLVGFGSVLMNRVEVFFFPCKQFGDF